MTIVKPVYKEGPKADCGNYRPISAIFAVAKLFEGIINHQLRSFISDNKVLVNEKSGFRPQHSTETTLISLTNEWLYNMDAVLINGYFSLT